MDESCPERPSKEPTIVAESVNVVVISYRRPEQLRSALRSLEVAADGARDRVTAAVTVVDDDPSGSAAVVAAEFGDVFEGGCHYVSSGAGNIAEARNRGLEAALGTCDWIGSIDDDIEVPPHWFSACHDALGSGPFTAVTGSLLKDFSAGPAWLTEQPFDQIGITRGDDGAAIGVCATGNNWVREAFVAQHPDLRFDPDFGVTGGEDVHFFWRAVDRGLRPVFWQAASVVEPQPAPRCTFGYQLRRSFWLGLLEARITRDATRVRLLARAGKRAATANSAGLPPDDRRRRGIRYRLCVVVQSLGVATGILGLRLRHR